MKNTFILIISFFVLMFCRCEDGAEEINVPPVISSLTADPSSIEPNGTSTIICSANDADNDVLSYSWSTNDGSIIGEGSVVTYTAPSTEGIYMITCVVNDENGGNDSDSVSIIATTGAVTDIDGNLYQTIIIGNQEWMAENLKVTHYRNGDEIPTGHNNNYWSSLSSGAYAGYYGDTDTYGYLYNWYAVGDSRNIAPEGWHVPTDEEWMQLERFLGMSESGANNIGWRGADVGRKLKEAGTEHWYSWGPGGTNESGFTALPGGYRDDSNGIFYALGFDSWFWSSTEYNSYNAWVRGLRYSSSGVHRDNLGKKFGFSIRCIRN